MSFFVFYSNKCEYCKHLLKIIDNEGYADRCKLICFESSPDKIPEFISNVPTIIAKNLSKPLIGIEAIEWIQNKKFFNQITNNIISYNVIDPNIKSALKELEFNKQESSSISDHYTNINDTNIIKNMLEYDKIDIDAPITNDITNTKITDIKITDELQDKKLRELILIRKQQIQKRQGLVSKLN